MIERVALEVLDQRHSISFRDVTVAAAGDLRLCASFPVDADCLGKISLASLYLAPESRSLSNRHDPVWMRGEAWLQTSVASGESLQKR